MGRRLVAVLPLFVLWVAAAVFVQGWTRDLPDDSRYHNGRWWNAEVGVHFTNTLGRYAAGPLSSHWIAVGLPCLQPPERPCTELEQGKGADELAVLASVPSPRLDGEGVYTSFPPGAFALSLLPVEAARRALGLDWQDSIRLWNRILQLAAAALTMATVYRLLGDVRYRPQLAFLSTVPMVAALEPMHSHSASLWAHQVYQPFIAATLLLLTYPATRRNSVALGCLCAVGCLVEWTAYMACVAVFFAVAIRSEAGRRVGNTAAFAALAVSGGIALLAYYAWLVGLDAYFRTMAVRFSSRTVGASGYGWTEWSTSVLQSYGAWLPAVLALLCAAAAVAGRPARKGAWGAVLLVSAFLCLENVLMFEHSIVYTFDRLKLGFVVALAVGFAASRVGSRSPEAAVYLVFAACALSSALSVLQYTRIYAP